jgi:hypothetical protein
VRTKDGSVRTFQQEFPPLFNTGDLVMIDGGELRLAGPRQQSNGSN